LYSGKNHETIRKYFKLYDEIIGQFYSNNGRELNQEGYDKLRNVNPDLFEKAYEKIRSIHGSFGFIPHDADSNLEREIKEMNEDSLNKMSKAIELMEPLLTESKNGNNKVDKSQNNSVSEPESKKRKLEIEAFAENNKKSKTIASELERLINEASGLTSYEELAAKIKEINEYQGEVAFVALQAQINQLKTNLGNLNKDKFRQLTIQKIESVMKDNGIKESDLDQETKNELARLKAENDSNEINQLENKISEKVGKKGALKTLND